VGEAQAKFTFFGLFEDKKKKNALEKYYSNLPEYKCDSSKEFITTLEYLRKQKAFELDEPTNQKVAHHVSEGCTGAAKRFITSLVFLKKLELGSRNSLFIAKSMAHKSDNYMTAFIEIFKQSYAKDYLNLDLKNSYRIARELSLDFDGDVDKVLKDFSQLAKFCSQSEIGLSRPRCAQLAIRIAHSGSKFPERLAPAFIKTYRFARDKMGAPLNEALLIAHDVAAISPQAYKNFMLAYKYALKNKGLNLPARSSLQFAMEMSKRSVFSTDTLEKPNRVPANQ
jgi:hypothetical protein